MNSLVWHKAFNPNFNSNFNFDFDFSLDFNFHFNFRFWFSFFNFRFSIFNFNFNFNFWFLICQLLKTNSLLIVKDLRFQPSGKFFISRKLSFSFQNEKFSRIANPYLYHLISNQIFAASAKQSYYVLLSTATTYYVGSTYLLLLIDIVWGNMMCLHI